MRLRFEYTTHVGFRPSIGRHTLLLRCLPGREPFVDLLREEFSITPGFRLHESTDGFGNRILTATNGDVHTRLDYTCAGEVEMRTYCIPDRQPHPMYTLPSQLATATAGMECLLPTPTGNLLADCLQVAHTVHRHIVYTPGITGMLTTAEDVFRHRKGVCQDYAHLMIALCRRMAIPARYACGLMSGEGQTHAWVEVHDGQCWYAFDPTNDTAVATGYIKLAHGRDAADCPVSRGIYLGIAQESTSVSAMVMPIP